MGPSCCRLPRTCRSWRPFSAEETRQARNLAERNSTTLAGPVLPVQVLGSGPDLNAAVGNGVRRAARLLDVSDDEIRNRATLTGGVEIGRLPGFVQITILAPASQLEQAGIAHLAELAYPPS